MQTHTLTLNGHPFFIRSWGDPALPRLILLHGFPEYGGAWEELACELARDFHCIAPDQRGYGQSWCPLETSAYTTSKLVSDIVALIHSDLVGAAPVSVMGHDWGASIAYALAFSHPGLVQRLIIANGVHPIPFQRALSTGGAQAAASQYINFIRSENSHTVLAENNCAKLASFFTAHMDASWITPERLNAYITEWQRPGRLQGMTNWYRASPLKVASPGQPLANPPEFPVERMRIPCKHLLLWGAKDTALLPVSTQGLEELCPELTRVDIQEADHWLLHQKPQAIAKEIIGWMRRMPH